MTVFKTTLRESILWKFIQIYGSLNKFLLYFQAMNFPVKSLSGVPSCTKSVTIRWNSGNGGRDVIKLRPNRDVLVNGDPPAVLPIWMDGIVIRHASSAFVSGSGFSFFFCLMINFLTFILITSCLLRWASIPTVELPNGLEIWWDGFSRCVIWA